MALARRTSLLTSLLLTAGAVGLGLATTASAHVTVAAPGVTVAASDAAITFRVPDESDTASTIGVKVQLPTDHPIAGVLVAPQPGWTAKLVQTKLTTPIHTDDGDITEVVSEIDWTADAGAGIKPGYFGQFTMIAGKLPDGVASLTFKTVQAYSDKSVVSWIEQAAPGSSAQPEHPAPVLQLVAAAASTSPSAAAGSTGSAVQPAAAPAVAAPSSNTGLAVTGVVLGALGLLLGGAALGLVLRRRTA